MDHRVVVPALMKSCKKPVIGLIFFFLLSVLQGQQLKDSLLNVWHNKSPLFEAAEKVDLLEDIGLAYKYSQPDSACYYFGLGAELAKEHQLYVEEANLISRMGGTKYILGDYGFSLEYFSTALEKHLNIKNNRGIAIGYNNIGLIYNVQNEHQKAIDFHKRSVAICLDIKDTLLLSRNYSNLAITYNDLRRTDSALFFVNQAINLSGIIGEEGEFPLLFNLKGDILHKRGEYQLAELFYTKVLSLGHLNNKWEYCYALAGLSLVNQSEKHYQESIRYGIRAFDIAKEIRAKWDLQNITKILAESYASLNDFENAYHYQSLFKNYSDSIYNEEKERTIAYFHLKRKAAENEKLSTDIKIQQQKIKTKNILLVSFIAGIILLAFVIVLLFRKNALKTSLNEALRRKNVEIDKKNKSLEQLNATKDTFFRIIAHDLKGPLGVMISFTDLLKENLQDFNNEEILEFIKKLHNTSTEGFKLLENLLDWARSQSGKLVYEPKSMNLSSVIEENILLVAHNAREKKININNNISKDAVAFADKNMTSTIMRNLLSNAVKFTPENGSVNINATSGENNINICVTDTGVGINAEDMDKLFLIEKKHHTKGTLNEKGSGIGLILCKEMVEKQGGSISCESTEGKGTTFCFSLLTSDPEQ